MRVYITDLEAYNNGHLVGAWLELPMNEDLLAEARENVLLEGKRVCKDSHFHEETFITDYESCLAIGEYDSLSRLNELAEKLESYSEDDMLKFRILMHEGYDSRAIIDKGLDEFYVDIYDFSDNTSFTDTYELLAIQFVDEGLYGDIPKNVENYLDYEKMARDLRMDYGSFGNCAYRMAYWYCLRAVNNLMLIILNKNILQTKKIYVRLKHISFLLF